MQKPVFGILTSARECNTVGDSDGIETDRPALLQKHYVGPAQLCQVVGYGRPDDASSTDHHTGLAGQWERLRVPAGCQAPRRGPQAPVGQSEARLRQQQSGEQDRGQSPGAPHTAAHNWAFCGRKQPARTCYVYEQTCTLKTELVCKVVFLMTLPLTECRRNLLNVVTPFSCHCFD